MCPHYNVLPELLFTCKPCCLQTCNYYQSLVVTDTNTPIKFQVLLFELWVSNEKNNMKNFAHHSPIDLRWRAWGPYRGVSHHYLHRFQLPYIVPCSSLHTISPQQICDLLEHNSTDMHCTDVLTIIITITLTVSDKNSFKTDSFDVTFCGWRCIHMYITIINTLHLCSVLGLLQSA